MTSSLKSSTHVLEILSGLSAKFVSLSLLDIDEQIVAAQQIICKEIGLDRSTVWQFSKAHDSIVVTHVWSKDGKQLPRDIMGDEAFPWMTARIRRGDTVEVPDVDALPPEASKDRESFRAYHVRSNVTVPMCIENAVFGCIAFGLFHEAREWSAEEVNYLRLAAQLFASAIDRKNREMALHESQVRVALASTSAGVGFWGIERETENVWATKETRELFGFNPADRLTLDSIINVIHPDDRDQVLESFRKGPSSKRAPLADFRVELPDGSERWLSLRGGEIVEQLGVGRPQLTGVVVDITARKRTEEELKSSLEEIKRLKDLLYAETDFLKAELVHFSSQPEIIGNSKPVADVLRQIRQVAGTNSTVLITGETGTGKELVARAVHTLSQRKDRVMVKVDCASLPSGLIESELFGRERGAYTGALAKQVGRFQLADKSTIFLDEIGELPLEVQAKLLRILESGEFEPLGSPKTIKVNVRVIAATNRDLEKLMHEGRFREDLYFRLRVFPINVPPLRERVEDIPSLAYSFVRKFSADMGKNIRNIRKSDMLALQQYSWPGNVRELRNLVEHALITASGDTLSLEPAALSASNRTTGVPITLAQTEGHHIRGVLERTGWRIKGKGGAADLLGVKPSTLYAKMKKLGVPSRRQKDQIKS